MRGFTLIEIVLVLAVFAILLVSSVVVLGSFRDDSDLQEEARGLQRVLELARSRTIASEGDRKHGVYIDTAASEYVLFQTDTNYANRVAAEDQVYQLRDAIEFGPVSFTGSEVMFERIQGVPNETGSAQLRIIQDPGVVRTVYVESSGTIEIDSTAPVDDSARIKDTRHAHIDYTRNPIVNDTGTEDIVLDFGTDLYNISITDNMSGGQFVWEDILMADGEPQTLKVHTHEFNNGFDSQFSVHRDRRVNTKPLTISLSDDGTGTLIEYDADGAITNGDSIYVTATNAQ